MLCEIQTVYFWILTWVAITIIPQVPAIIEKLKRMKKLELYLKKTKKKQTKVISYKINTLIKSQLHSD